MIKAIVSRLKVFSRSLSFSEINELTETDVLLFCGDSDRGFNYSGQAYSQILDSLNERFMDEGLDTITITKPYSRIFGRYAFGKVFSLDGLFIRAYYSDFIFQKFRPNKGWRENLVVNAWMQVLDKANPVVVVGIQPPPELCLAGQRKGIRVYDLQHGVISGEGYYGKKYRDEFDGQGWPHEILTWDRSSQEWIEKNIGNDTKAKVIGNPWFLRFKYPQSFDKLVDNFNLDLPISDARPVILVTLQWGTEGDEDYFLGMNRELFSYIKEAGENFVWWIRAHPVQLLDEASDILKMLDDAFQGCPNLIWEECSRLPLPFVLRYIDLHITSHSAVTIETSWFGIKTALLNKNRELLYEYFGEQIKQKQADVVHASRDDIDWWLKKNLDTEVKIELSMDKALLDDFISETRLKVVNRRANRVSQVK